jgi:hypothetical protein
MDLIRVPVVGYNRGSTELAPDATTIKHKHSTSTAQATATLSPE